MAGRRTYARDARGRFAPTGGSSSAERKRTSTRSRRRSTGAALGLAAGGVTSKRLLRSPDPRAKAAGALLSVGLHISRNPAVRDALGISPPKRRRKR